MFTDQTMTKARGKLPKKTNPQSLYNPAVAIVPGVALHNRRNSAFFCADTIWMLLTPSEAQSPLSELTKKSAKLLKSMFFPSVTYDEERRHRR